MPARGRSREDVLADVDAACAIDLDWRAGRHQGWVYWTSDEVAEIAEQAMHRYYYSNPLLQKAFPSLTKMGSDILETTAGLINAPAANGTLTTGGSESNILAVWAALQHARRGDRPLGAANIVVPYSAHPTFDKAGWFFGIDVIRTPLNGEFSADVEAAEAAITPDTVLLVGSAPEYSHGIVDPIVELGELASERDLPLHVDACVGGFMLPFVERLGRPVPTWDFRVPGVTSVSADVHKHGLGPKGTSVLVTRSDELAAETSFRFANWPHGNYATTTIAGSRSGASLAAAWAVFQFLGEAGFLDFARRTIELTDAFIAEIEGIADLRVLGAPAINKFAYTMDGHDVLAVADGLEERGWTVTRQADPEAIGMQVEPYHDGVVADYGADLAEVADLVRKGDQKRSDITAAYN